MAEQLLEDQYDVDLTGEAGEYDASQEIDAVDLFEYVGDEDSPIARLKSLVLSIDWEITDDILEQFITELLELKSAWAEDEVKQVYVQGLEKIAKYIYKEKANANPNAIKLLLTFYRDLEKIVTTESMDYEEKQQILLEDVKKFEFLKKQIFKESQKKETDPLETDSAPVPDRIMPVQSSPEPAEVMVVDVEEEKPSAVPTVPKSTLVPGDISVLRSLKAAVLGIDWEITDIDLNNLAREVHTLEETFSDSKAKLIFLQGIGALGAYINLKRSDAHAKAFTLLRSFFDGMEKVIGGELSGEAEKEILLAEVDQFNEFKQIIAAVIPESIKQGNIEPDEGIDTAEGTVSDDSGAFLETPFDAELTDDDAATAVQGFFGDDTTDAHPVKEDVGAEDDLFGSQVGSEVDSRLEGFFGADSEEDFRSSIDTVKALQGVDVESPADDDSDEEPLLMDEEGLAPALSTFDERNESVLQGVDVDDPADDDSDEEPLLMDEKGPVPALSVADTDDIALRGVDVDDPADDDSDEEPLPEDENGLAPALSTVDDEVESSLFGDDDSDEVSLLIDEEGLAPALSVFDDDDIGAPRAPHGVQKPVMDEPVKSVVDEPVQEEVDELTQIMLMDEESEVTEVMQGVDVETEADDDSDEEPLMMIDGDYAPALETQDDESGFTEDSFLNDLDEQGAKADIESRLDEFFTDDLKSVDADMVVDDFELSLQQDEGVDTTDISIERTDEVSSGTSAFSQILQEAEDVTEERVSPEEVKEQFDSFFASDDERNDLTTTIVEKDTGIQDELVETPFDKEGLMDPDESEDLAELLHLEEATLIPEESEVEPDLVMGDEATLVLDEREEDDLFGGIDDFGVDGFQEESLGVDFSQEINTKVVEQEAHQQPNELTEAVQLEETGLNFELSAQDIGGDPAQEMSGNADIDLEEEVIFLEVLEDEEEPGFSFEEFGLGDDTEAQDDLDGGFLSFDDIEEDEALVTDDIEISVPGQDDFVSQLSQEQHEDGENIEFNLFGDDEGIKDAQETAPFVSPAVQEERAPVVSTRPSKPSLDVLQKHIGSIGIEVTESVLRDLLTEVSQLNLTLKQYPIEKIFLQLISTIVQQIKQSRFRVHTGAYTLLQSVFDRLEYVVHTELKPEQIQEYLLTETSKVLLWQQTLLDVHIEEEQRGLTSFNGASEEGPMDVDESYFIEDDELDDAQDDEILFGDEGPQVSGKMDEELSALRNGLQSELAGLREDLRKG